MIIGIDASKAAIKNRTGIENFVYEVVLNIIKTDRKNSFLLFSNQSLPSEFSEHKNVTIVLSRYKRLWNKLSLPLLLRKNQCDVYLQPSDAIPMFAPKNTIGVFHDFAYEYFPKAYSFFQMKQQLYARNSIVKKAKEIVCVSDSTKIDLLKFVPDIKTNIDVINLGYNKEIFHEIKSPKDVLKINEKYILYVGRIEERKNVARLVKAFYRLKDELKIPHKLVLAGGPGYNFKEISETISSNKQHCADVLLPGHIAHDRLPDLIAGADVFVFPTLYEGFGLPLLEAMACGAAIITSKNSSLPDIGGDAAVYINPLDENDLTEAMAYFIFHPEVTVSYRKRGVERAAKYSWEKTASEFLKLLETL
jgi:glycosyltransferase involved in cell wall biosynthesis